MKVLVTGSRGFVGTRLCKKLLEEGATLIKDTPGNNIASNIPTSNAEGVDVLVHLAARTNLSDSISNPYDTYHSNLIGTLWALETARINQISKFVYLSSYVYGQPDYLPIDEKHRIKPQTPYHKSKYLGEKLGGYYYSDFGINIVVLRSFTLYGPEAKSYQSIPRLMNQIHNQGEVILSTESIRRDFLFIEDFVSLIAKILKNFPNGYNIYNVGSGRSFGLLEIAQSIAKLMKRQINIIVDKNMVHKEIIDIVADVSKVKSEFSWVPLMGIQGGLQITVKDYQRIVSSD